MATVRISGIQMSVGNKKAENLPRILEHIQESDCDIIVFPEMSLTGHNNEFSDARTLEAWDQIAAACRVSYTVGIVGTGSRADGISYIQGRIFADDGEIIGTHEKLIPTEAERKWCRPGSKLKTFEHQEKEITFGCLCGNDLWVAPGFGPYPDPRLTYQLGERGVDIIFHLNASGTDNSYSAYYESNLQLRAKEANCYIVTVNAAVPHNVINVPSGVISPEGEWVAKTQVDGEQKFNYDIVLD